MGVITEETLNTLITLVEATNKALDDKYSRESEYGISFAGVFMNSEYTDNPENGMAVNSVNLAPSV